MRKLNQHPVNSHLQSQEQPPAMLREQCPACQSRNIQNKFHEARVFEMEDIPSQIMELALCTECGFLFQNPVLPSLQTVKHYAKHSTYVSRPTQQMQNAHQNQFEWISSVAQRSGFLALLESKHLSPGLFDIGASVGALLHVAQRKGWMTGGIEPSAQSVEVAQSTYGIHLDNTDLQGLKNVTLPIISMSHVFEHLPAPKEALAHLYRIAQRASLLCLEVPDLSAPAGVTGSGFFVPEHTNYFTAESLSLCTMGSGWKLADIHVHQYVDADEFCPYPVLRAVLVKLLPEDVTLARKLSIDSATRQFVQTTTDLRNKIQSFVNSHDVPLVLFGAGFHTSMLMGILDDATKKKIRVIVDSNQSLAGSKIEGIPVEHASELPKYAGLGIVISSQGYQSQIIKQIRESIGDASPILTFYES